MIVSPSMSARPNRRLYTIAIAAAVGIVAVALKFVTGGWLFFLAYLFLLAPALALVHVLIHAWSCDAVNVSGARAVRMFSNAALIAASLAQVDYDDKCGWYAFTALISPEALCMRTHPPLFGPFHNFVVLAPLLASWLVLLIFPRDRR